ncbi:hypothetical protein, partial [Atlantibacter hermannii]|uniref:hypothetical protein n=1 Tax=Atlantibacter hermannii TaxID=565 RepID=UPI0028AF8948
GSAEKRREIDAGQALIKEDYCDIWIIVFQEEKVLIIALSGQVILTAYLRRSGTHHFHPERPS